MIANTIAVQWEAMSEIPYITNKYFNKNFFLLAQPLEEFAYDGTKK